MHGLPHFILCHVYILLLHLHVMCTYYRYTCMSCLHITVTHVCHISITLLPMHVWFLYFCHMIPRSYYMYYYSMFPYSCYMIDSCYNDMDIPVTGPESCWYAICGILFPLYCSCYIVPVSRYIVLCYQQNSGPVIMLPVSCTVCVLVTLYTWHIR